MWTVGDRSYNSKYLNGTHQWKGPCKWSSSPTTDASGFLPATNWPQYHKQLTGRNECGDTINKSRFEACNTRHLIIRKLYCCACLPELVPNAARRQSADNKHIQHLWQSTKDTQSQSNSHLAQLIFHFGLEQLVVTLPIHEIPSSSV